MVKKTIAMEKNTFVTCFLYGNITKHPFNANACG
jgi:hypothetical protein